MECRLVQAKRGKCRQVHLYLRCEDGSKRHLILEGFPPYFYVPSKLGLYTSIYGEALQRIEANCPEDVPKLREKYPKHYEADVPYIRRYLIDTGLHSCLLLIGREPKPLEACSKPIPLLVWYLDIEVYSKTGFPDPKEASQPVISVSIYDSEQNLYYTIGYTAKVKHPVRKQGKTRLRAAGQEHVLEWHVELYPDEESLLLALLSLWQDRQPDIIAGWNIGFDLEYLFNRSKRFNIELPHRGTLFFDLSEAYKTLGPKQKSNKLKYVTVAEGLETEQEALLAPEVLQYYEERPSEVYKYNLRDVWRIVMLNKRHSLIEYYITMKDIAGVEDILWRYEDGRYGLLRNMVLIDTLLLRQARKKGVALPSKRKNVKETAVRGAVVLEPVGGIHEGVAVLDMSKYYPALIISFNISPETKEKLLDPVNRIWRFRQEPTGLIPEALKDLLEYEDSLRAEQGKLDPHTPEYEDLENKIMAVKGVRNSFYGVMASPHFRLYDPDIASTITGLAREGIVFVASKAEELGYKVLYGDTDSVFIKVPFEEASGLAERLTEELKSYFRKKYGLKKEPVLKLKFEKYYSRIFFKPRTKKRYAGLLVWKKGQKVDPPKVDVTGFEVVRTDVPDYSASLQKQFFALVLRDVGEKELSAFLEEKRREMRQQPLYKIALVKGLSKEPHEYRSKTPAVRAALYGNLYLGLNYTRGDKVHYIHVKRVKCPGLPQTDVAPVTPEIEAKVRECFEVDWKAMEEKVFWSVLDELLSALGYSRNIGKTGGWW